MEQQGAGVPCANDPATENLEAADACTSVVRAQFDRQFTPTLMKKLDAFVSSRAERLGFGSDQALDRLHAAIVKTLDGTRRWDPARVGLGAHLLGVVSSQMSHELSHGDEFELVSLDGIGADDDEEVRYETEDALARSNSKRDEPPASAVWALALSALRDVSRGEPEVLRILSVYELGIVSKRGVMRAAKLHPNVYDAAYARLMELVAKVDDETRSTLREALG